MAFVTGNMAVKAVKNLALKAQVKDRHTADISRSSNIKLRVIFDLMGFIMIN
jgi:hypothetical protein